MHTKTINVGSTIHLNQSGRLFMQTAGAINQLFEEQIVAIGLESLRNDPFQHFFRMPFNTISYVVNGKVVDTIVAHPSSFYPGSPFDVFMSVKSYLRDGKHIVPRFYLYPSSACDSKCIICPFAFRHSTPHFIQLDTIKEIIDFMDAQQPRPKTLSTIISGDGEPTLHKDMGVFLTYLHDRGIRTFLSSNFILPGSERWNKVNIIADTVSMLTISMKGLSPDSYYRYQGVGNPNLGFDRVIKNIEALVARTRANERRSEILIGIASLILPENTGNYVPMSKRFVDLGLDFVYFNVVEPSYKTWGIEFSDEAKAKTLDELGQLCQFTESGTMIRFSMDMFKGTTGQSVYYDARTRQARDICGSALWNPLFMSLEKKPSVIACRAHDKFQSENYTFTKDIKMIGVNNMFSADRIAHVMSNTEHCEQCRLERQVRLFDELIRIERTNRFRGEFVLDFSSDVTQKMIGTINFESTFKRS